MKNTKNEGYAHGLGSGINLPLNFFLPDFNNKSFTIS